MTFRAIAYYSALTDHRLDALDTLLAEDFEEHELPSGSHLAPRASYEDTTKSLI
jgi:hypothetical protein